MIVSDTVGLYLATIFRFTRNTPYAKTSQIASALNVRMSSVSDMLKHLDEAGYIIHNSRTGVRLTETGNQFALARLRKHRILETFLVKIVGYQLDEVHDEAESMEHVISDRLIDRLEELLDYPRHDPHGHPIPDRDGAMGILASQPLSEVAAGATAVICEIDDANGEKIRYLRSRALVPGTQVEIMEVAPMQGPITVLVNGAATPIAFELAQEVKVFKQSEDILRSA